MAGFLVQFDARRLLKILTVSSPKTSPSSRKQKSSRGRDSSQVSCDTETLKKKYEELGRLLTLQHLEQNVLSSVEKFDVCLESNSTPTKEPKRKRGKSAVRIRQPVDDEILQKASCVLVRIPQAISGDSLVEERVTVDEPARSSNKPKSGRVKPVKSQSRNYKNNSIRQSGCLVNNITSGRSRMSPRLTEVDGDEYCIPSSQSSGISHDRDRGIDEDDFPASGRLHRYIDRDVDDYFIDISENEPKNDQSFFVIEGEITETITNKGPSSNVHAARVVDITEVDHCANQTRQCKRNESVTNRPVDKSKKSVSFCANSDEEEVGDRVDGDSESNKYKDEASYEKEDLSSLNIVLENEILNNLLQSPRPGLYQEIRNNEKEVKRFKSKKKKKKKTRRIGSNNNKITNSKDSCDLTDSLQGMTKTSPRVFSDCNLETTKNPAIKLWLRQKNKLSRQQKRSERHKEKMEQLAEERKCQEQIEKLLKSEEAVAEWERDKERALKERLKVENKMMNEREVQDKIIKRNKTQSDIDDRIGRKFRETVKKKIRKKKGKKTKVHPAETGEGDDNAQKINGKKKVSYDEWLCKKRTGENESISQQQKLASDPLLDNIIPSSLCKKRIERATRTRGRRLCAADDKEESHQSDLPESDQKYQNPFKLPDGGGDRLGKTLRKEEGMRSVFPRKPSSSNEVEKTKKFRNDSPASATRTTSNFVQGSHQNARFHAWAGNDRVRDSGSQVLNSAQYSNAGGCHGNVTDCKEEDKDEGIFLTESTVG